MFLATFGTYVKIHLPFPNKQVKPDFDFDPHDSQQTIDAFSGAVPIRDQYWVILSRGAGAGNMTNAYLQHMALTMKRTLRWRDQEGTAL